MHLFKNKLYINFAYNIFLKIDYNWVITLNRFCLSLFGAWPEFNETPRRKLMINLRVIIILNIIIWSCIVPSFHSLIWIWGNITSMIDNLRYTLPLLTLIIKLILLWQKKKSTLTWEKMYMQYTYKKNQNLFKILFFWFYYKKP